MTAVATQILRGPPSFPFLKLVQNVLQKFEKTTNSEWKKVGENICVSKNIDA